MPSYSELLHYQLHDTYSHAHKRVFQDYEAVYERNEIIVGWPERVQSISARVGRPNTVGVIGMQWGDEGKGRYVDNKLEQLLEIPGVNLAYVIRFQGGSNAGHTVIKDGKRVPLHQLPSGVLYPEAVGLMDSGMFIHMEDLQTEIVDAEAIVGGDLRGKLVLSEEAMLTTDLERAEEVFLREKTSGMSKGGTGRGAAPTVAHFIDRQGQLVQHLFAEDWEETFAKKYDQYERDFGAWGKDIADAEVPDLRETRNQKKVVTRKVGTKKEYLDRLRAQRSWFIERDRVLPPDKHLIQNTFPIHQHIDELVSNRRAGAVFEGAQAMGLNVRLGRRPDTTPTDTSMAGIHGGTKYWMANMISEGTGVAQMTYDKSVGSGKPLTVIPLADVDILEDIREKYQSLGQELNEEEMWQEIQKLEDFTPEEKNALWIREVAHEKGTTTGRYRDICYLDLEALRYNIKMSGIQMLAGTHLDVARADQSIRVCTHYTDEYGNYIAYQPGLEHQKRFKPHYIDLPGFDGQAVRAAKSFAELPENAQKLLSFIQRQTGVPITFVSTGPERHQQVRIPKFKNRKQFFANAGTIYSATSKAA